MDQLAYWNSVSETKEFTTPFPAEAFARHAGPDAFIADIGCGYGRTLHQLYGLGYRNLAGFDFSEGMIRRGKRLYPELALSVMENGRTSLPDESADAVVLFAVLTCIAEDREQERLISEVLRILKPGGILCVNDFLLNTDERNEKRYREGVEQFGTYGVFALPEGAIVRHHSLDHLKALLSPFPVLEEEHPVFKTMHGHTSNGFFFLGEKPACRP